MPRGNRRRRWTRLSAGIGSLCLIAACTTSPGGAAPSTTSTESALTAAPRVSSAPSATTSPATPSTSASTTKPPLPTQVLATHLDVPWALAFLPDGSALLTLRDRGELMQLRPGQPPILLGRIPGVVPGGEGGLLGVAVSPTFTQDRRVFVYVTTAADNRVERLRLEGQRLSPPVPVLTGIRKGLNHNGGRLAFGPDGYLYVTTGDATEADLAQQRDSLNGKILRITQNGAPAPGNPFPGSPIWSYGHRNVEGLAWAPDGRMFASELGLNTWDELNLITPGRDYGWPLVEGRGARPGLTDPLVQWPTDDASPSGIAVAAGAVWVTALRGESLWRVPLTTTGIGQPQRLLQGRYGRLRDAIAAPDGRLWILTDNTFRGQPTAQDDRVVAIALSGLG